MALNFPTKKIESKEEAPKALPLSSVQQKILALQAASKAAKDLQNPASIKALEPKKLMSL